MASNRQSLCQNFASYRPQPYSIEFKSEEIDSLSACLCDRFGWSAPRSFQLEGIRAQLTRRDAIIHVATSMGKTAVAAGPFALPSAAELVIIYIIPLLALQDEMASLLLTLCSIK
jgi:replicative superfamily II helicase